MQYELHVNLFARPAGAVESSVKGLRGVPCVVLCCADGRPLTYDAFFPMTFEQAIERLARLPRLDAEPDGFFVMAGGAGLTHWSVSGQLFDFDGRLHRVELNGRCPPASFEEILKCFGWPETPLVFELVEQGVALDDAAFLQASRVVPDSGA